MASGGAQVAGLGQCYQVPAIHEVVTYVFAVSGGGVLSKRIRAHANGLEILRRYLHLLCEALLLCLYNKNVLHMS